MLTLVATTIVLAVAVGEGGGEAVRPDLLYYGVGRPVMVTVEAAGISVALLDGGGELLATATDLPPGQVDLAAAMPGIWTLGRIGSLQCLVEG